MTPEEFTKAREVLGLDKRKAAQALGVSYSAVIAWENGQNRIPKMAEKFIYLLVGLMLENRTVRAVKAGGVT